MKTRSQWQDPPSMDPLEAIRWLVVFVCEQRLDGRIDVGELKRMHREQVEELRISRGLSSGYDAARELFALRRAERCKRLWGVYQALRVLLRCEGGRPRQASLRRSPRRSGARARACAEHTSPPRNTWCAVAGLTSHAPLVFGTMRCIHGTAEATRM